MSEYAHDDFNDVTLSSKMVVLFSILKESVAIGDKMLVFSQSLYTLDVIEHFLASSPSVWEKTTDFFRIDGQTSVEDRQSYCNSFNRAENSRAK